MKIALLYDRVNKWGGAERVLVALHEIFPEAPLFTAVYSSQKAEWAKVFPEVIPTFLQKIPFT
ncbi:MAG: glycosyltransferase family 4 protein, partial [Patescibacteria group bacterium]